MANYQPLEMTARPPMLDAWSQLNQTLGQRRQESHQADLEEQQRKRQDFADFQSAYLKAKQLADSGDHAGAAAIMAPWHGRAGMTSPSALANPSAPPGAAPGPAPQGGSPMPDRMEFKPQMPQEEGPDGVGPDGRPVPGPIDQGFVDSLPQGAPSPQPPAPNPLMAAAQAGRAPAPADHPLVAANEASKAKDQQRGHGVLYFTPPGGGQEQSYDPTAVRDQQMAENTAELDHLIAQADPETQALYGKLRPAILASGKPVDPTDMTKVIASAASEKASAAVLGYRSSNDTANREQRGELRREGFGVQERGQDKGLEGRQAIAGAMAARGYAGAATTAHGALSHDFQGWTRTVDWKGIQSADRSLKNGLAAIASGNPLSEQEAKVMYGRFARGTTPTEGEMHLLYSNLAGRVANFGPKVIERWSRGGATDDERAIVQQAMEESEKVMAGRVNDVYDSAVQQFGPGTGHDYMAGNINGMVGSMFTGAGYKVKPIYEGEGLPTVQLGVANPYIDTTATAPGAKPKPKGGAKPKPAATTAASGPDAEAIKWVNDPKNASDPHFGDMQADLRARKLIK